MALFGDCLRPQAEHVALYEAAKANNVLVMVEVRSETRLAACVAHPKPV